MDRCPKCGRFVQNDADGYYDSDVPELTLDDGADCAVFCGQDCSEAFHPIRTMREL